MQNLINELNIIIKDENNSYKSFFDKKEYLIPLYQREFAWEKTQIDELIEDIYGIEDGATYYIGSLIISKRKDNKLEVIDGQQRLTTLYLLLKCLNLEVSNSLPLDFECRKKSNYTLKNVDKIIDDKFQNDIDSEMLQDNIVNGIKIIKDKIRDSKFDESAFKERLSNVILYQIEVPQNTDLNHYFEIMNTRGEQLEQHDIVKATLMSYLGTHQEKEIFATIWVACSNMNRYVQMNFDTSLRTKLFGEKWNHFKNVNKLFNISHEETKEDTEQKYESIKKIVDKNNKRYYNNDASKKYIGDGEVMFESIIDFPYFLLHTLKVFVDEKKIKHTDEETKIIDELLDDKKLINSFKRVFKKGKTEEQKIDTDKRKLALDFIACLLKTRFLFDKYLIKRQFTSYTGENGEWSLKSMQAYGEGSKRTPNYINTDNLSSNNKEPDEHKRSLMLQSALRVSYTSPKVMHWITVLLKWLTEKGTTKEITLSEYNKKIEEIAIERVREFLKEENKNLKLGTSTPHLILNYLDYVLWEKEKKEYEDFKFEFRNSVEHWYPQNPSSDSIEKWSNVDTFGNLCILQSNINSRFNNLDPMSKKNSYTSLIDKGSIKLRKMSDETNNNKEWRESKCYKLEEEMVELLKAKIKE